MKTLLTFGFVAALAASYAFGAWVYEGQWGRRGSGNGEVVNREDVAIGMEA